MKKPLAALVENVTPVTKSYLFAQSVLHVEYAVPLGAVELSDAISRCPACVIVNPFHGLVRV